MFSSATAIPRDSVRKTDICVVGSGPAGLSLARSFLGTRTRVLLLESGGEHPSLAAADLAMGKNVGRHYRPLEATRTRAWGGSGNCWGGMCVPMDPLDFEKRDYVPNSGWPISYGDLEPYYRQAQELTLLGPFDYETSRNRGEEFEPLDFGDVSFIRSGVFQMSRTGRRYHERWREEFEDASNIEVMLNATVTHIGLHPGGREMKGLTVQTYDGNRFKVVARAYVLATGGIDNPRLLLASTDVNPQGVGNDHDLVGRYFMEHPHTDYYGVAVGTSKLTQLGYYDRHSIREADRTYGIWGFIHPSPEAQRRERILNAHAVLYDFEGRRGSRMKGRDFPLLDPMHQAALETDSALPRLDRSTDGLYRFTFGTPSESAPIPESRVRLSSSERDGLGVPRVELDWRTSPLDARSIRRFHELIARSLGASGLGRMHVNMPDQDELPRRSKGGMHHMGTTRMHDDPKQGVCDANGKVHGVHGLYMAGSSLFTTSGAANPTLTIVALALRQAEHLKSIV